MRSFLVPFSFQVEVARLEDQTYHLHILCQKGHGVLVQLMQALESFGIDVVNAHHTSFQDNILNTFVAQVCVHCLRPHVCPEALDVDNQLQR
jgi:hypothetical protein